MRFIQFMPQKPAEFGIKYWLLCDVKTSCVLKAIPYVGKEDRPRIGVVEHVAMSLMEPYHNTGQNVTTDNYFTSLKTAKNLLQHNIMMVGTLQKNKREIPLELHADAKQQSLYTSRFLFAIDGIMILYYEAKKKDVFLLPSIHTAPVANENEAKKKPEASLYYSSTKGGLDTADFDATVQKLHHGNGH